MTVQIDHNDIRWRVSNTWQKGDVKMGMLVGYIDARTCMEALDSLDPNWSAVHGDPIIVGNELIGVPCALTVNNVTRSDVGMPSSQDPIKGAYSDALKRAAVHFDIGRELYELPKIAVECEIGNNGKVKGPKATPVYRDGRWTIDRKYGWVRYDREPDDQPERDSGRSQQPGRRSGQSAETPAPARSAEEKALIEQIFARVDRKRAEELADQVGVPKNDRANAEQLRAMLALIEQPEAGVPASPVDSSPSEGSPDSSGTDAATAAAEGTLSPGDPQSQPLSMDDVLAAAGPGAEEVPPLPDEDPEAYREWFDNQPREVRMKLRAQGRAPQKATAKA